MDNIFLDLGLFQIRWYSLLMVISIFAAYILVSKESSKKGLNQDNLLDMSFYTILVGIVGARAYYVLFNLEYYASNIKEIFMVWHGGLAIHGALISALIFLLIYTKKKKINIKLLLDIIVVGLLLGQAIGRWGNFFNQEAFGRVVEKSFLEKLFLPDFIINGMYINGAYREPTFLYESILSLIGFTILQVIKRKNIKTGTLTSIYLIWYGTSRLIIESMRADSLMLGSIRIAQLVSILGIVAGIVYLIISSKKHQPYREDKLVS